MIDLPERLSTAKYYRYEVLCYCGAWYPKTDFVCHYCGLSRLDGRLNTALVYQSEWGGHWSTEITTPDSSWASAQTFAQRIQSLRRERLAMHGKTA